MARSVALPSVGPDFWSLAESFRRSLLAENKSAATIKTYGEALRLFGDFLARRGMPQAIAHIRREHVEAFIADLLARCKPATASNRYRALQQFFTWAAAEGEIKTSPMINMKPLIVPEAPPPVLDDGALLKLLKACEGKDLAAQRDTAIIRLLLDTGMRRGECAGLTIQDLDFEHNVALVVGKGRRPRACPFGRKAAQALDRYLRVRALHRDSHRPALWLGHAGPLTPSGVYQVVRDRARAAGLGVGYTHLCATGSLIDGWRAAGRKGP